MARRPVKELSPDELTAANRVVEKDRRRFPRQTLIFAGIVLGVLTGSTAFTGFTWRFLFGASTDAAAVVLSVAALSFVPVSLVTYRRDHLVWRGLYASSAWTLSFLNYAIVAALVAWIAWAVSSALGLGWNSPTIAIVTFGAAAVVTLAGLLNAAWLRVTRITIALPNLPRGWRGRTLAVVSDIHLGNLRRAGFTRRLVTRLNALAPDAVLIAGDMFDGTAIEPVSAVQPWSKLAVKHGAFFVTGNHDEFSDRQRYLRAIAASGIRVLNNEKTMLAGLQLIGVHDGETHRDTTFREILRRAEIDRNSASILIAHQPSRLGIAADAGVSLHVSGHTHRGQFWPWTIFAARVHGPFVYGLQRFGAMHVLTSSGVGSWGPPIRIGTRAEIVSITLSGS